jgi:hypothetical protein
MGAGRMNFVTQVACMFIMRQLELSLYILTGRSSDNLSTDMLNPHRICNVIHVLTTPLQIKWHSSRTWPETFAEASDSRR